MPTATEHLRRVFELAVDEYTKYGDKLKCDDAFTDDEKRMWYYGIELAKYQIRTER